MTRAERRAWWIMVGLALAAYGAWALISWFTGVAPTCCGGPS